MGITIVSGGNGVCEIQHLDWMQQFVNILNHVMLIMLITRLYPMVADVMQCWPLRCNIIVW